MHKCPNCFHKFKKQDALFRCASIPQICPHVEDETYNTFHKDTIEAQGRVLVQPPRSKRDLLKRVMEQSSDRACDSCSTVTHQRVCPHCHHNLPDVFWDSDFVPIGFVCQRPQELEAYVTYLKKILEKYLANDLGYILKPEVSATKFDLYLERAVGEKKRTLPGTRSRKLLHIRFYPTDPEHLTKDFLGFEGVLLMCDKMNAAEGRSYVPDAVQNFILATQRTGAEGSLYPKGGKISIPFGVVYNCFEALAPLLPPAHPLFQQGNHGAGYNQADGARISSEMLAYTGYWFGPNLLQLMKRYFSKYRLFCQSFSYPEVQPFLANSGWRIEDPFLWVLKCSGRIG